MTKNIFLTLFLTTSLLVAYGQKDSIYLTQNAVKIDDPSNLTNDFYKLVSDYQLIMIGEMHGTNEPARIVNSFADLLTKNGNNVQVGLEIPSDQMTKYLSSPLDNNIFLSDFFATKSTDGRASFAWANIISNLNNNPKVEIFFYDINKGESITENDRDSLMYLKIKKRIQAHPTWKTITICGNIHNMLTPYRDEKKVACYLNTDKDLNISSKILSLNHEYGIGTMLNSRGNGLKLQQVDNSKYFFARTINYENYLFLYRPEAKKPYTGIYFTRKITAAKLVSGQ
jgi:hypothetical protein